MTQFRATAAGCTLSADGPCALLLPAGCAWWIPKGDPPAAYLETPEMKETLEEVSSRLQNWPDDRWWEQFENPELNGLMEQALKTAGADLKSGSGEVVLKSKLGASGSERRAPRRTVRR